MKHYFALVAALLLAVPSLRAYTSADEEYIRIYNLIQQADTLMQNTQSAAAYQQYQAAEEALKKMQVASPGWNEPVIQFRLKYVTGKMAELAAKLPESVLQKSATPKPAAAKPAAPEELEKQVQTLKDQLQQLEADRNVLAAKLKEALSAQPATADPRELAKAEEKLRSLQKENDLLKAGVEQQKAKVGNWVDPSVHAATEKALADANRKLAELTQAAKKSSKQRAAPAIEPGQLDALRAENEILKRRLAELEKSPGAPVKSTAPGESIRIAKAEAALERDQNAVLLREKKALEKELADARKQIKANEEHLAAMQTKLAAAKGGRRSRSEAAATDKSAQAEVASLRARLAVLEASKVPYTPEELALFKQAGVNVAVAAAPAGTEAKPNPTPPSGPPPGSESLMVEAKRLTAAGRYAEAEKSYQQVLRLDENNPTTLANLASVQLEMGRLNEAEANLKRALAAAPNDPFNLYLEGALRYHQDKIDEAFDALSRAAKLDPDKAVVQNLLGVVMIQKGLRDQAETSFRKAIQIFPEYAEAHMNLARVYALHKPPLRELARWHYQKALDAGASKDAGLEKFFEEKPASSEVK